MGQADEDRNFVNSRSGTLEPAISLLFYCRVDGGTLQPQTPEVRQAAFFARNQLPVPLLDGAPSWVDQAFAWHEGRERQVYFDKK